MDKESFDKILQVAKVLPDSSQVFINKELYDFRDIVDWEDLIEFIRKKKQTGSPVI